MKPLHLVQAEPCMQQSCLVSVFYFHLGVITKICMASILSWESMVLIGCIALCQSLFILERNVSVADIRASSLSSD